MKYSIVGPPEELSFSYTTRYKVKDEKGRTFELKYTRTNISDEYLIWDENKGKWVDKGELSMDLWDFDEWQRYSRK